MSNNFINEQQSDLFAVSGIEEKPLNSYEQRQEAKRQRYLDRAEKGRIESKNTLDRARSMASVIPFGQPILVGHHSEGRDRRYRARIHDTYGKAFALDDKAKHYENKAASVGTGGISSDDPEAISKLRQQLSDGEAYAETIKKVRRTIRGCVTTDEAVAALIAAGFSAGDVKHYLTVSACDSSRFFFSSFVATNNNANLRRIRLRIEQLEKLQAREDKEEEGNGYTYREDKEENRILFVFEGKPAEEVRRILKTYAFKWSPTRGAWVRQITANALFYGARARKEIDSLMAASSSAE